MWWLPWGPKRSARLASEYLLFLFFLSSVLYLGLWTARGHCHLTWAGNAVQGPPDTQSYLRSGLGQALLKALSHAQTHSLFLVSASFGDVFVQNSNPHELEV